jgi:hypothetical protein
VRGAIILRRRTHRNGAGPRGRGSGPASVASTPAAAATPPLLVSDPARAERKAGRAAVGPVSLLLSDGPTGPGGRCSRAAAAAMAADNRISDRWRTWRTVLRPRDDDSDDDEPPRPIPAVAAGAAAAVAVDAGADVAPRAAAVWGPPRPDVTVGVGRVGGPFVLRRQIGHDVWCASHERRHV